MYQSEEEINKVFGDHLKSLELSGLPFDAQSVGQEWQNALDNFRNGQR